MQRAKEISVKFSHTRPDGTDSTSILSEYGIPDYNGSENIAAGYTCPEDVIEGWMNSPGHRVSLLEYILNASWRWSILFKMMYIIAYRNLPPTGRRKS